eukprot:CAMPEP_0170468476 /NCGR_PEP_ID=MMETSP0123-20130129/11642_1 /TAXON_ID=182087 /ORGANISM="Favella ehrenbergii, Strain Fehren 1" /LENGTH=96 /DNA_ID=CAMNT_0010735055 /DNA_START=135 /DNA_END=425 /DNA_ORIENTATION=-
MKAKNRLSKLQRPDINIRVYDADQEFEASEQDVLPGYKEFRQLHKAKFTCWSMQCANKWSSSKVTTSIYYKVTDLGRNQYEVDVAAETYSQDCRKC